MMKPVEVDVWIRGTTHATTHTVDDLSGDATTWSEPEVQALLTGMLRAVQEEKDPEAKAPAIRLRGFSWIVSPDPAGGVLVHLEMQSGTASSGPFGVDEHTLSSLIARVLQMSHAASDRVH